MGCHAGPAFVEPQDRESRTQASRDALRLMPTAEESQAATQRMTDALPQAALVCIFVTHPNATLLNLHKNMRWHNAQVAAQS